MPDPAGTGMEPSLYRYIIQRSLRHQLLLTVLAFVVTAVSLAPTDLRRRIINKAIAMQDLSALFLYCGLFLVAVLASGGLKYVITNYEGLISEVMLRDLRTDLYHRILRFPLPHFRNTSTGQLIAMIIGEVEDLGLFFGQAFSVPLVHGLKLLGNVGYMVWLNPWMATAGVALYPLQIWVIPKLQRRVSQMSRDRVQLVRGLSDHIQESVTGIQEILANDTFAYESEGYRAQLYRIFQVRIRIYNLKYFIKWINNFLALLGPFFLFLIGGLLIIKRPGSFDVGSLVAFLAAYEQLNEPWRELLNYYQQKEVAETKYETVIANFDVPGLRAPFPLEEQLPAEMPQLAGAYEARGATVELDGRVRALDQVQFALAAHRHVAVVGTAGSGRTTLSLVLAKLYGYTGSLLLDSAELAQLPSAVAGRQIAYVGIESRLFTGTVFDNLVYGLRHRAAPGGTRAALPAPTDGEDAGWLDLTPLGGTDQAGLSHAALEAARLVGLDEELFAFGLRAKIDPVRQPEIAARLLTARRLVAERFERGGGEPVVELFDRQRFAAYASIGENILFGYSPLPVLALDRLAENTHFRRVVAEVGLRDPLVRLGAEIARDMVEIFRDIAPDNELFANLSLIAASELPDYTRLVARAERAGAAALSAEDQEALVRLSLRLIPARHRLGRIDEPFTAKVVAARLRFAESLPAALAGSFQPYDRDRYFADGTLLENMLFGKVVATSSLAVKKVNAVVEEVIVEHGLRDVVLEAGLGFHVGLAGSRLSPAQRQKVALARALLKRPQILILDQATSAVDPEKRAELHQRLTIALKGRTLIAVVDRLDLARYYDHVLVLDAGKVAEQGTFQELAARPGLFRHLADQAGIPT